MRIACLQFAPQVGDVSSNLNRADAVLSKADPAELDNLDLLVLPEMAFSGYNFKSLDHIKPYLEPSGSGISALWARTTALKYDCTVAVGYPEKVDSSQRKRGGTPRYYNSLLMVNGDGETLANYRKSFLYYTDATWAQEGKGFFADHLDGFGRVAMGICMDINPYKFEAPWNAFEFGVHITKLKANLVILSMAWLTQQDQAVFTPLAQDPDMDTLTYWVQRLEPLIRSESDEETIVVFCNRCGIEDDVVYAGTSAVIGIKDGEVSVYGLLGRGVKEMLIVNTEAPPFAKLVNRPDPVGVPDRSETLSPSQMSPTQDRLGGVPEAEEPPEVHIRSGPTSPLNGRRSGPISPTSMALPESPAMVEPSSQGSYSSLPSSSTTPPPLAPERDDFAETDAYHFYKGCDGPGCSCNEQTQEDVNEYTESPVCPSPTPASVRPKLSISTSQNSLPPLSTKAPPRGTQPGNFFTSRDLCTPPITAFDDNPMSAVERHPRHHTFEDYPMTAIDDIPMSAVENFPLSGQQWPRRNQPPAAFPSNIYTPEEPVWPLFQGSTRIDFGRTPARAPPPRPSSRNDPRVPTVRAPSNRRDIMPPRPPSRPEASVPSRPPSRPEPRLPSRPPSRLSNRLDADTMESYPLSPASKEPEQQLLKQTTFLPSRVASPEYLSEAVSASSKSSRAPSRSRSGHPSRAASRTRDTREKAFSPVERVARDSSRTRDTREKAFSPVERVARDSSRTRDTREKAFSPVERVARDASRTRTRTCDRSRDTREKAFSPVHVRHRSRGRSTSASPVRRSLTAPADGLLGGVSKESIFIVASPSVFATTFDRAEVLGGPAGRKVKKVRSQSAVGAGRVAGVSSGLRNQVQVPVQVPRSAGWAGGNGEFESVWSGRRREGRAEGREVGTEG